LAKTSISGFLEWLPEQQIVEDRFVEAIRTRFELAGFAPLRSRAIEPLSTLLSKGETDKEIFTLSRLQAGDDDEGDKLGLHFDLTVPFARFVGERAGSLHFPFKRYQIQPAWRGERPQEGRYREFLQADADVIGKGSLPLHYDAELPALLIGILDALPMPPATIRINNRKILDGFMSGLGIEDVTGTLRKVDKLGKIGEAKLEALLRESVDERQARAVLALCRIRTPDASFADAVRELGVSSATLDVGLAELATVMDGNRHLRAGAVVADLSIARGFDYYTGTVYEGTMAGFERVGAVCSGGRYDDLVAQGAESREAYPGVGVSIGVSRILGLLIGRGHLVASRATPTCVLVALNDAGHRADAAAIAHELRSRGIAAEPYHEPESYKKQLRWAQRLGIPYVWFHEGERKHSVKNMTDGTQTEADLATWQPAPELLRPAIRAAQSSE
jgi:histidyl-tRNA synthetase